MRSSRENIKVRLLNHSIWISDEDYMDLENLEIFFMKLSDISVLKLHNYTVWELESGLCSVSELLIRTFGFN